MGLSVNVLNIDLHPWREYVKWRFLFAASVTVVLFAVSQNPLIFIQHFPQQEKLKMIKIEGLIYIVILAVGTGLYYYAVQDPTHTENYVIERINAYQKESSSAIISVGIF